MSFQWVIDNAASISIQNQKKVAQTVSRSGQIKATSLGVQPYQFSVRVPDGPKWSAIRQDVAKLQQKDRTETENIQISNAGHSYLVQYQGDETDTSNIFVFHNDNSEPNHLEINSGFENVPTGGFIFKAGDIVQLENGRPYTVIEDVPHDATDFEVHRPITEPKNVLTKLFVGTAVTWQVICAQLPDVTVVPYDSTQWSGNFVFVEVL